MTFEEVITKYRDSQFTRPCLRVALEIFVDNYHEYVGVFLGIDRGYARFNLSIEDIFASDWKLVTERETRATDYRNPG